MTDAASDPAGARGPSAAEAREPLGPRVLAERRALRLARLAWAGAMLVQGLNLAYEVSSSPAAPVGWLVRPAVQGLGILLVSLVLGHSLRLQAYKRGWKGRAVTPSAYLRGNALTFAALTLGACLLLGFAPGAGTDRGIVRVLALALGLATALNWPHGKPMRPAGA